MRFTSSNKSPRSRGALRTGVAAAVFAACAAVAPANAATEEKLTIGGVDAVVWSAQESADSNCTLSLPALSRNGSKPSLMWSDGDFRDRADDVRAVVKAL
ncbi:MAG TPA: hypothetical protein VNE58_14225, partial [Casimicrobiaceae bacterium]|nr:hypothetical protein [Casimicrobiaceae bacterium]